MSATKINVPDLSYSSFYYPEILRAVRLHNRIHASEITAEVAEEPFIQAERAFALASHLCNVLLDLAACECLLETSKLADSVRLLLQLIDYSLRDYSPASSELLLELAQVPTSSVQLLEAATLFSTERTEESDPIPFEVKDELYIGPANIVDAAFGLERDRGGTDGATVHGDSTILQSASMAATVSDTGAEVEVTNSSLGNNGAFTLAEVTSTGTPSRIRLSAAPGGKAPNFVAESNLHWTIRKWTANQATELNTAGAPYFTPWTDVEAGDKFYIGSKWVLWDVLALTLHAVAAGIRGVWEYFDPELSDESPDSVTNIGGALKFDLTSLLGSSNRSSAFVKVTYLPTGSWEVGISYSLGGKNLVETSGFLGQSGTPSTDADDYSVGTDWQEVPDVEDGTSNLTEDGDVEFTLPQTTKLNWQSLTIQGVTGWFLRYRVLSVTTSPTKPEIDRVRLDTGSQYVLVEAAQGETVGNEPLASSTGLPNQKVTLSSKPGLRDSVRVFVDEGGGEVEWLNLTASNKTLVNSGPKDRHFVVAQDSLGTLMVRFGDGTRGRVPTLGVDNIRFEYRVNATDEGNVGAGTVTVNSDGAGLVKSVTNPRPAFGWREADGASAASLARAKEAGPASLRAGNRAVNPEDYETLALDWKASDGSRPVVRAKAIEEGFGPKTVKLLVVGTNGVALTAEAKEELELYFNGEPTTRKAGVGGENTEVTVVNFSPRTITPNVTVEANEVVTDALVRTTLTTLVSPTARESDAVKFVWQFGGRVATSRLSAAVFAASPGNVFDVDFASPSADVELGEEELPVLNTDGMTVTITAPRG